MRQGIREGQLRFVKEGGFEGGGPNKEKNMVRILEEHDATALVGISTIVLNAAVYNEEDDTVEVPKLRELMAATAVARCLVPIRLRGSEIRAIRKIMQLTLAELASRMDGRAAPETVSRWESENQPMGGYAEKVLRLVACEALKAEAPGVPYDGSMIAQLRVSDPWKGDADFVLPAIVLKLWQA